MQTIVRNKLVSIGLLATALGCCTLFIALGMWQLDRAEQKRTTLAEFELRGDAAIVDLNRTRVTDSVALAGYRSAGTGRYLRTSILLDNQLHQGRAGYGVYTVFQLEGSEQSILVNRGWIRADPDRRRLPQFETPTASLRLEGRLSPPPVRGLRLEGSALIEHMADDRWRVQAIDFADLATSLGEDLLTITLQLDQDAPHGFVRAWIPPGNDEARHLGYAFQWFAMAMTIVVIAGIMLLRSGKAGSS